ncbi:hypothetical protein M0805_009580 [Coniferiporia weirii]|nr:hypothetical protein M0805_009580 [Coniferiporia weirii]
MASINIEQPLSTPAHEWAADTTDALTKSSPEARGTAKTDFFAAPSSASPISTPGEDFPGAFPREPRDAVDHLSNAAPTDDYGLNKNIDAMKQYIPAREDVQRTMASVGEDVQRTMNSVGEAARNYLPESMVNTLGLPVDVTDTAAVNERLSPTSDAKRDVASVDNMSTTGNASSTQSGSLHSELPSEKDQITTKHLHSENEPVVVGMVSSFEPSTSVMPNTSLTSRGNDLDTDRAPALVPLPESSQPGLSTDAETPSASHLLPTPPPSDAPSASSTKDAEPSNTHVKSESDVPAQSTKDQNKDRPAESEAAPNSDGKLDHLSPNTSPTQAHVTSGGGVSAIGGTTSPESSPASNINESNSSSQRQNNGTGDVHDTVESDGEGEGAGGGKKGGRARRIVEKMKEKLHHK